MSYKVLKVSSFYSNFLNNYYRNNSHLTNKDYTYQYEHLMSTKYGWSDFFKQHFLKLGIEVIEIVHNARYLQQAWAEKFECANSKNILLSQIEHYKPDVIFFQDTKSFSGDFIKHIRTEFSFVKIIFGHICAPFSNSEIISYQYYDFILTCLPIFQDILTKNNIKSYIFHHGFETSIVDNLTYDKQLNSDFTFIGSLLSGNDFHNERTKYIEYLLNQGFNLKLYTHLQTDTYMMIKFKQIAYILSNVLTKIGLSSVNHSIKPLQKVSVLKSMPTKLQLPKIIIQNAINSNIFGIDMYNVLANSKITFNTHGGIAANYAANVRMFEATGVGSLLLTDYKENIRDFFEPDYEVVTYKSPEECKEKLQWLLQNPEKASNIAKNGQKRTFKTHSLESRFYEIFEIINKHLK